MEYSEIGCLGT